MRLALLAALTLAACDTRPAADGPPDFGMGYSLDAGSAVLAGDTVRASVGYSGGCEAHTFTARSRPAGEGVEVWFVHGGPPDPCEAYVTQTVEAVVTLPAGGGPVVLLAPNGPAVSLR